MRRQSVTGFLVMALLAGLAGGYFGAKIGVGRGTETAVKETAYDRVMRTGTLRCGYVVEPPYISKDMANGRVKGVIADVMEETGRLLNIKVEWPEEVGWGNAIEAIRGGRVDAICVNFWMNPSDGKNFGFSMPLFYGVLEGVVRADDRRFDNNVAAINDASVTVSSKDGELSGIMAREDFPKAKVLSMPNLTDAGADILNVVTGKADITFVDALTVALYDRSNPGKIRNPLKERAWRAYPATIALPQNDMALKTMLDSAFVQLLYSGFVDRALDKYDVPPNGAFRVAKPYVLPPETTVVLPLVNESDRTGSTQ
jgi:polar amino acid transport system substrate-binding protein